MAEFFVAGEYVDPLEVDEKELEGVSTSNAGFVGVTQQGPPYTIWYKTAFIKR